MDNSYRVVWEIDVDAPDAKAAAGLAYSSIVNKVAPVFEVHQWREPEMIHIDPVAMIDITYPDADLPVPDRRSVNEQYMGPDII